MSKKPSFEDALRQKMSELPLPDENASWQKMNALLDEKEKRRGFFFFRNEKIAGVALLLCMLLLWAGMYLYMGKKVAKPVAYQNNKAKDNNKNLYPDQAKPENDYGGTKGKKDIEQAHTDTVSSAITGMSGASDSFAKKDVFLPKKNNSNAIKKQDEAEEKDLTAEPDMTRIRRKRVVQDNHFNLQNQRIKTAARGVTKQEQQTPLNADSSILFGKVDSTNQSSTTKSDDATATTTNNLKTDSALLTNKSEAAATVHVKRRGSYFVDAGIGISQQVPLDSQAFVAYNDNGKRLWIGDYIPSLYIRLEKEKKWFVQGEFHYAAPRLVKPVAYRQKTEADYGHGNIKADRYYLQKTWYHEVPLSFNVYLRPSWSVGVGAMYNILRGASVKKTASSYDALSGQYTDTTARIPWRGFTDSFLYKTNTSLLLQTDYAVKRWSFGVRYRYDVQPFLTYTLPDGAVKDKRNQSLEVLIRYRFYRSGKFRIGKL